MRLSDRVEEVWTQLADTSGRPAPDTFDPESLKGMPDPAARWLRRVVPVGAPVVDTIMISMTGEIKIGRWRPFTAKQILRAGVGFVWKPVVGGRLMRFMGADLMARDDARMEFRFQGLVPFAKASGPDTAHSAAGRLAAETVAWLPQASTPQAGARWTAVDDQHAIVSLDASDRSIDVRIRVDAEGRLRSLALNRWNDSAKPPGLEPFGGELMGEFVTPGGARVAGSGTVGWGYGTPDWDDGKFLRYTLNQIDPIAPT